MNWTAAKWVLATLVSVFAVVPWIYFLIPSDKKSFDVQKEWNKAISALGIEPIYPPEEDIYVGDILAIVTHDELGDSGADVVGKSIRLTRVDASAELKRQYASAYSFKTSDSDALKLELESGKSIFDFKERESLPIVLLPNFALRQESEVSSTGDGYLQELAASLGISARQNRFVEVSIPFAETYGINSLSANGLLWKFCKDPTRKPICTQERARALLSMAVGEKIFDKTDGKYRFTVDIVMLNRLYLIRSIVVTSEMENGASGSSSVEINREISNTKNEPAKGSEISGPEDVVGLQDGPLIPGFGVKSTLKSSNSTRIFQEAVSLPRPVVIGFRAVRETLKEN